MISSLLSNLSSALARVFVIGIVPLLAFLVLHGMLANAVFPAARMWMRDHLLPEFSNAGLLTFASFLLIITVAYVWNSLSLVFREILEGKYVGQRFAEFLGARYLDALGRVLKQRDDARVQLDKLNEKAPQWASQLRATRIAAQKIPTCTYQRTAHFEQLLTSRQNGEDISANALDRAVADMLQVLRQSSADIPGNAASDALDRDLTELRSLIEYSRDRWSSQLASALERVEFDFGGRKPTATRMGNIAQSIVHYAQTRYGMRLDTVWPRLQKVIGGDAVFNAQLEEANTRLDFVVSLFWQTLLFTLVWSILLPLYGQSRVLFVGVAAGGGLACVLWYHIAVQNYRALASIMRAGIDMYRHELLAELGLALPRSLSHERAIWDLVEQHVAYGSRADIPFKVDKE